MIASNSWLWLWRYGKQRLYTIWFTLQPFLLLLSPNTPTLWVPSHFPTFFLLSFLLLILIELCCLSLEAFWLLGFLLSLERKSSCLPVFEWKFVEILNLHLHRFFLMLKLLLLVICDWKILFVFFGGGGFDHMQMSHDNLIDQVTLVMIRNLKIYQ
jgi:hypothetical protein